MTTDNSRVEGQLSPPSSDYEYDDELGDCWNCGGEGFVSDCFEEYACLYPEDGCDLCTRRCDVCRPRKAVSQ